jgi:hypothetical protein
MDKKLEKIKAYAKGNEALEHSAEMLDLSICSAAFYKKEINETLTEIVNMIEKKNVDNDELNKVITEKYKMFIKLSRGRDDEMRKEILG